MSLKNNMISLGILENMRYNYKCEHDQLKVCIGFLIYFKVVLKNGFYYLDATWEKCYCSEP